MCSVCQVNCECAPELYKINDGYPITLEKYNNRSTLQTQYCYDRSEGGGLQSELVTIGPRAGNYNYACGISYNPWTWDADAAGACQDFVNSNIVHCQCSCHECKQEKTYAVCASSTNYYETYCYKQYKICPICPLGQYNLGCGCIYCDGRNDYNESIYKFNNGEKCKKEPSLDRSSFRWMCGPGICALCPPGYVCLSSNAIALPVKCPAGSFKRESGFGVCKACECARGKYFSNSYNPESDCDHTKGLTTAQCLACSECTNPLEYTSSNNNYKDGVDIPSALCPSRNYGKGFNENGECVSCIFCSNPKEYALPTAADFYCLTSNSNESTKCKERYYSMPYEDQNNPEQSQNEEEFKVVGKMPWKPTYKRNYPKIRNTPGDTGIPFSRGGGHRGHLPYYTKCEKSNILYGGAYEPTTNETIIKILTDQMDWQFDCMREFTAQCSHNHYAIISDIDEYLGIPSLIQCLPCQNNTVAPVDHRGIKCDCGRGSASQISFRDKYGELDVMLPYGTAIDGRLCVDCFDYVYWRHSNGDLRQEALTCTRDDGDGIKHCTGLSFVNKANQSCQKCQKEFFKVDSNNNVVVYVSSEIPASSFSLADGFWDVNNNNSNISHTTTANISLYNSTVDFIANSTTAYLNISHVSNNTQLYATSSTASNIPEAKQKIPHLSRTGCYYCSPGTRYKAVGDIEYGDGFYECEECDPSEGQYQDFEGQAYCKNKIKKCSPGYTLRMNDFAYKDHDCVPCDTKCGGDQITVMSSNKTFEQDTCNGDGITFFGCYDGSSSGAGPSFQPGTRLVYKENAMRADVQSCDSKLLPVNSEWVSYRNSKAPGIECYFACSYGVNKVVAGNFTSFIDAYVKQNRVDLKPFNNIIMPGTSSESTIITFDELWLGTIGSKKWSKSSSLSQYKKNDAMASNTFLFIEDAITKFNEMFEDQELCMSATAAYTLQCPIGFTRSSSFTPQDYNCVRDARNNLYCSQPTSSGETTCSVASCVGTTCRQVCESESSGILSNFRVGCTVNCIDLMLNNALSVDLPLFSRWRSVFDFIIKYLRHATWDLKEKNPYNFVGSQTNNCSPFTCKLDTFLYSIEDHGKEILSPENYIRGHSACIPCDKDTITKICGLFNPVRFPIDGPDCTRGGGATVADVCTSCSQQMDNATLISNTNDYVLWLEKRRTLGSVNGKLKWDIPCRYYCAKGYTSNNESPDKYMEKPCIRCFDIPKSLSCTQNITTVPIYYENIGTCGEYVNNIDLFIPQCKNCAYRRESGKFSFSVAQENPLINADDCLAMCDASKYHSFLKNTTNGSQSFTIVDYHIPYKFLMCESCDSNPNIACNGKCEEGYYHDNSTSNFLCMKCNESACGSANYYRETCVSGSIRDAECVPCPSNYLKNDPNYYQLNSSNYSSSLLDAVYQGREYIVRRWVSNVSIQNNENLISVIRTPFPQCLATCVNNYVWIDIQTGLFPRGNNTLQLSRLYCIRCDSNYIRNGLVVSSGVSPPSLYSFWNNTNESIEIPATLVGSVLNNMVSRRVKGGCYSCAGINIRNVIETSTEMCELKAGVTSAVQGSYGTATFTSSSVSFAGVIFNEPATLDLGRRRLLSVQATGGVQRSFTIKKIKIRTQPILHGITYTCCELLTIPSQQIDCKKEMDEILESKKLKYGEDWGSDYCKNLILDNSVGLRRRLLTQQDTVSLIDTLNNNIQMDEDGTCFTGTYKEKRGDGGCFSCPSGTSTIYPFTGATDRTKCQCLPGFSSVRVNNSISYCTACGWNYYRTSSMNDSTCIPCAQNMHTPTRASSYCYCNAGFYRNFSDDECVKCEPGFYCPQNGNNARIQCPVNSMSYIGAYHRGNCTCNSPAYYGYLLNPTFECIPRPPGLKCKVDDEGGIGSLGNLSCSCAFGWNRVEIANSDNGNGKDNVIFRCISKCSLGEYAILNADGMSILTCKKCPMNTYSSISQAIEIKSKAHENQCTPCPPNTDTRGKEGIYNISECLCSGEIILSSTIGENNNNNITNNSNNNILSSNSKCGTCEAGTYLDLSTHACKKCPEGTTSFAGDMMGISACLCEPGHKATKKLINLMNSNSTTNTDTSIFCEPCPIGYFSNKLGSSCTACGKYTTTLSVGSKSIRDCILIQ